MVGVIVRHRVKDFDAWRPVFEEHGEVRRRYGGTGHEIYRAADDPQEVIIVNLFQDAEGARGFMQDPSLQDVMQRAGVIGAPEVTVCEQAEVTEYSAALA